MKNDALQLFVRGFETSESGDKIVRVLQEYGFDVKEQFDGSTDSLGGLIETHVTPVDSLACDDLDEIVQAVRRVAGDQVVVQHEFWDRMQGGDDRRPPQDQGAGGGKSPNAYQEEAEANCFTDGEEMSEPGHLKISCSNGETVEVYADRTGWILRVAAGNKRSTSLFTTLPERFWKFLESSYPEFEIRPEECHVALQFRSGDPPGTFDLVRGRDGGWAAKSIRGDREFFAYLSPNAGDLLWNELRSLVPQNKLLAVEFWRRLAEEHMET
jgi:hypothetical protein